MELVVQIPDRYLLDISASELAGQLKLSAALLMFRAGRFSAGAACEFAGIDRYVFLEACRRHRIDVFDYEPDELEADFIALQQGGGAAASC
jgi:predicted HTH domain antitoxin